MAITSLELKKRTGISFPLKETSRNIYFDEGALASADLSEIESLVPDDCKQRARYCSFIEEKIGYDKISRFLDIFPNLTRLRLYECWYETPSLYAAFKDRPIEGLELSLFVNDVACFDPLSTLTALRSLEIINLNSALGIDKINPELVELTIHAPDLTMDQCMRFKDLQYLNIHGDGFEPEVDYPKLAELTELRRLTMPVYGDTFKYLPDMPMLEEFKFAAYPCCEESFAYFPEYIRYEDGDFDGFPTLGSLRSLELNGNNISRKSLETVLGRAPSIERLKIMNSKRLKNDDLLCITQLSQLEKCWFIGTKVKGSTMKKLALELPNCEFEL